MSYEKIKSGFFIFVVSFIFGVFIGAVSLATFYERRLGDSDRQLREYRELNNQLESDYRAVTTRATELADLIKRRREIDRRAIEQAEGIGRTIGSLSLQSQDLIRQIRAVINVLKEIKERTRLLEELINSSWGSSNTGDGLHNVEIE